MARRKDQRRREADEARKKARLERRAKAQLRRQDADQAMRSALSDRRTPLQLWMDLLQGRPVPAHRLVHIPRPTHADQQRTNAMLEILKVGRRKAPNMLSQDNFHVLWELAALSFIRPPSTWKPKGRSRRARLASLTEHLLVRYPVPPFVYSVLDEDNPASIPDGLRILALLGQGTSPRALVKEGVLRAPLTRRMCTLWLQQKVHLTWLEAIRHAQVQALGGDRRLAEALSETRLGRGWTVREPFWQGVIQWFCNQAMLDPRAVGPLVDYIHHTKDGNEAWSIAGRTPASLDRGMAEWHGELARVRKVRGMEFKPSGIAEGRVEMKRKKGVRAWTITEVLCTQDLLAEGRELRHCVYSYASAVQAGRCSIWSVREHGERLLTVEVINRDRRIVQVRGRCNRMPTEREAWVLKQWAAQAGLKVNVSRW